MNDIRSHHYKSLLLITLIVVLATYCFWTLNKPLPLLKPTVATSRLLSSTSASTLTWPASTQAAVGIVGSPILETKGTQKALPTASTAKIITALMVLKQKPLQLNQQGPAITLTDADVALYNQYVAQDGSVVPVQADEQISEYQALQAIMLPSANNLADSLAVWAYGSHDAYAKAANDYMATLGLKDTHIGSDASGLAPDTVSTASDLAKLGKLAMEQPVLAQIVGQSSATGIPLTSSIKNVNVLLGTANIIGIKTGNSDQAGGVYVSASKATVNGKSLVLVTAVVGAPDLVSAMQGSLPLVKSAQTNFTAQTIMHKNVSLGTYKIPWAGTVAAIGSKDLTIETWNGSTITATTQLDAIAGHTKADQPVGKVIVSRTDLDGTATVPVVLKSSAPDPSLWWRLSHPLR